VSLGKIGVGNTTPIIDLVHPGHDHLATKTVEKREICSVAEIATSLGGGVIIFFSFDFLCELILDLSILRATLCL